MSEFLQNFINQINNQYTLNLTIQDACRLIKDNFHTLDLPENFQNVILNIIQFYENDFVPTEVKQHKLEQSIHENNQNMLVLSLYWPWEWNFFGLNDKHKQKIQAPRSNNQACCTNHTSLSSSTDQDLPTHVTHIGRL